MAEFSARRLEIEQERHKGTSRALLGAAACASVEALVILWLAVRLWG